MNIIFAFACFGTISASYTQQSLFASYPIFGCISKLEHYSPCGNVCEMSCTTIGVYSSTAPVNCIAGCYCRPGFARNTFGRCVNQRRCPNYRPVCPVNEVFVKCGPPCQRFCDNRPCTTRVTAANPPSTGCYCKSGYARNVRTQRCIKMKSFTCKIQRKRVLPMYFRRF